MGIRARLLLGILVWALAFASVRAATVQATLDRHHVTLGDSVTLTLKFSGTSSAAMPDLSPLRKDFRIEGQSSSSSESWVNGAVHAAYSIQLSLRPRHAGTLHIPSLDAGGQHTQPLTLDVAPPSGKPLGQPGDVAYVKVKLSTHTPYVGEQVALDLRLYYSSALTNGNLPDPVVAGAKVRRLGKAERYQTVRDGHRYFVVERHYALIPGHAGTLDVPPVVFSGQALQSGSMGSFFANERQVSAQSASQVLHVKPRPAAAASGPWLPARQVELNLSGLPANGKVQVGEPVTVTLQEGATGLPASALPEPSLPSLPGADVYPDHPKDVTRDNGQWLTGSRTRSFAIVPAAPGTLHLPAITLRWWNVVTNRVETARIPAHDLTVVGAAGSASAASTAPPAAAASTGMSSGSSKDSQGSPPSVAAPTSVRARPATAIGSAGSAPWRWVALGSIVLWLATFLAVAGRWWWARRRRPGASTGEPRATPGARTLRNAFLAQCRGGDERAMAQALLAWARSERPQVKHLRDLASRLQDAEQRRVIGVLEQALFGRGRPMSVDGEQTVRAFRPGLRWAQASPRNPGEVLPPLYPRH